MMMAKMMMMVIRQEQKNAIDITFELIKDQPKLKKREERKEILYSENDNVNRILKESEISNLNSIKEVSISERTMLQLEEMNKSHDKKKKVKEVKKKVDLEQIVLDPPILLSKSLLISSDSNLAKVTISSKITPKITLYFNHQFYHTI
jgi:uncharacterized protein YlbG (UPF0298 family)